MTRNNSVQVFKGGWKELPNAVFTTNQKTVSPSSATNTFAIKPDGTELYILESNTIKTFPLVVPYDPDSRGTLIRSFTVTDDALPVGVSFQDDGSKMFVGGQSTEVMLAYTLPVPFDTDSIIASPASLSLGVISGVMRGSTFSRDGDFLFVTSDVPAALHSFPLPTPWDITSNVSNTSLDPGIGELFGITFKPEGDKMYLIDLDTDEIVEFDLSTVYDITTAVANGNTIDLSPCNISDVIFRSTGLEVFVIDPIGLFTRLHLDEAWNISTASRFTNSFNAVDSQSIVWKPDGTKFFSLVSSVADRIDEFTVPVRWNQANAVGTATFALAGISEIPRGIWVTPDGKTCMIVGATFDGLVVQLNMSTGWSLSTMSDPGINFETGITSPSGVAFTKDQKTFYVISSGFDTVLRFDMAIPLDIVNAFFIPGNDLDLSSFGNITDIQIKPDDKLIYFSERTGDRILMFSLPSDKNISNAVFLDELSVGFLESNLQGFYIKEDDGKKIWIVGLQSGAIQSMDMSLEFNNALITEFGDELATEAGDILVYA